MPQKTFVNKEIEKLDIEVNDFAVRQDVDVFATHTDAIVFMDSMVHKVTVFFTLVTQKKNKKYISTEKRKNEQRNRKETKTSN